MAYHDDDHDLTMPLLPLRVFKQTHSWRRKLMKIIYFHSQRGWTRDFQEVPHRWTWKC
jgi:hypothetical protein